MSIIDERLKNYKPGEWAPPPESDVVTGDSEIEQLGASILDQKLKKYRTETKSETVPVSREETIVNEAKFLDKIGMSLTLGKEQTRLNLLNFEAAVGMGNWERNKMMQDTLETKMQDDPIEAKNWFEKSFLDAVGMTPAIAGGLTEGMAYGGSAAAAAAVAGQTGPQIGTLEEAVTVPGAFGMGMQVGQAQYWYRLGVGEVYNTMRESGIDHEIASPIALAAGIPYAAIEQLQINKIIPGIGNWMKGRIRDVARNVAPSTAAAIGKGITEMAKRVGIGGAINVGQEGMQKGIEVVADEFGKEVSNKLRGTDIPQKRADEIVGEMVQEMKDTAGPMAFMMLPGAANSAINSVVVQEQLTRNQQEFLDQVQKEEQQQKPIETEREVEQAIKEDVYQIFDRDVAEVFGTEKTEQDAVEAAALKQFDQNLEKVFGPNDAESEFVSALGEIFGEEKKKKKTRTDKVEPPVDRPDDMIGGVPKKKYGSARKKFWALINSRGITREQLQEAIGYSVKTSGKEATDYESLSHAINILETVQPQWTETEKLDFIKFGVPPMSSVESSRADFWSDKSVSQWRAAEKQFIAAGETALKKAFDFMGIRDTVTPMLWSYRKTMNEISGRAEVFGARYFDGGLLKAYKKIIGNDKKKAADFVNIIEGKYSNEEIDFIKKNNPQLFALSELAKEMFSDIHRQAIEGDVQGVKIDNKGNIQKGELGQIDNYFPHGYDYDPGWNQKATAKFIDRVKKSVKQSNKKKGIDLTDDQALIIARNVIARIKKMNAENVKGKASGYQFEREANEGGWIGDPNDPDFKASEPLRAMIRYIDSMSNVIAQHKVFGQENELLQQELNKIGPKEDDMYKFVSEISNNIIGNYERDRANLPTLVKTIKSFQAWKLQYAATGNMFQVLVTNLPMHTSLGLRRAAVGFFESAWDMIKERRNSVEFASSIGALSEQVTKDLTSYVDNGMPTDNWMLNMANKIGTKGARAILSGGGFKQTEFYNNVWAAVWGKQMARDAYHILQSKRPGSRLHNNAIKMFEQLGIKEEALDALLATNDQVALDETLNFAAYMTAIRTQFRQTPMDLPQLPTTNGLAKLAFTFKGFAHNFARFQKEFVWKPAWRYAKTGGKEGSLAPALTLVSSQLFAAEARNFLRYLLTGKEPPDWEEETFQRVLWDIMYSGGFGIAMDFILHVGRTGNPLEFFAGPVADDISDLLGKPMVKAFNAGGPVDGLEAFVVEFGKQLGTRVPFAQTIDHLLGTDLSRQAKFQDSGVGRGTRGTRRATNRTSGSRGGRR